MEINSNACKQDLKSTSNGFRKMANEAEHVYVKGSSFLGSETGSNIDPNQDEHSYLVPQKRSSCKANNLKTREICKEIKYSKSFPPPLSSINGVKVEVRREGGRLLITTFTFSTRIYLKAERENGRLRLSLVKDGSAAKIEEEEDEEKVRHRRGGKDLFSSRCNGDGSKKLPTLPVCVAFS